VKEKRCILRLFSKFFSKKQKSSSTIEAFNRTSLSFINVWTSSRSLQHGAGIAVNAATQSLFVVEQDTNSVLLFDARTGNYKGTFLSNLDDAPEQIFFSSC
jgi:DNA-binding beta-propeller fold protein YncE